MTPKTWLLVSWIAVGAAVLVAHLAVLRQALRSGRPWRLLAFFPPAAPIFAWLGGARVGPVVWVLLVVGYLVLRGLEGTL